jgi:hypothetical protein
MQGENQFLMRAASPGSPYLRGLGAVPGYFRHSVKAAPKTLEKITVKRQFGRSEIVEVP